MNNNDIEENEKLKAEEINWTKEDINRIIKEAREIEAKANKYDRLVERIKESIELHKDYFFNQAVTSNPTLDAHFKEKERYIITVLQELMKEE